MYYTNKETFVLSADGCMDTERGGLESILAGNDEGAKGCCFSVAMSADGIAVLSSDGCAAAPDGTRLPVSDYSYAELHQAAPQLTPVSQAQSSWHAPVRARLPSPCTIRPCCGSCV